MNLVEKYIPKSMDEIVGQDESLTLLIKSIIEYKKGKGIILYGPYGCGKTSSIYAISKKLNLEIFEMNASDYRNKDQIKSIVGNATQQHSLFGYSKKKLILVDDIDGMSGNKDRGGITALKDVVNNSKFPIVMTLSNPFDAKYASLRKKSIIIEFKHLDYKDIYKRLKVICKSENIDYDNALLEDLAMRSGGDLRAAINDLELLTSGGKLDSLDLISERDRTSTILQALLKIFKTKDAEIASSAFYDVDEDVNKQILWLEENLPKEYSGVDLANALDCISRADVYLGRIRRWQYWRFLVYANNLLTSGVALSKKERYKKYVQYKPTTRILKMWIYKNKYLKRKSICEKIAYKCHTSVNRALKDIYPFIFNMIKQGDFGNLIEEFDLTIEEVNWMKKQG